MTISAVVWTVFLFCPLQMPDCAKTHGAAAHDVHLEGRLKRLRRKSFPFDLMASIDQPGPIHFLSLWKFNPETWDSAWTSRSALSRDKAMFIAIGLVWLPHAAEKSRST
jgi:hypothetical protein